MTKQENYLHWMWQTLNTEQLLEHRLWCQTHRFDSWPHPMFLDRILQGVFRVELYSIAFLLVSMIPWYFAWPLYGIRNTRPKLIGWLTIPECLMTRFGLFCSLPETPNYTSDDSGGYCNSLSPLSDCTFIVTSPLLSSCKQLNPVAALLFLSITF